MDTDSTDNGGPAFPAPDLGEQDFGQRGAYTGMTLRDYFAAKAMQGWLASYGADASHPAEKGHAEAIARASYLMADAMLKARASLSKAQGASNE